MPEAPSSPKPPSTFSSSPNVDRRSLYGEMDPDEHMARKVEEGNLQANVHPEDVSLEACGASDSQAEVGGPVRKVLHNNEWWFSIIDVIRVLVGGDRPRKYWSDLKQKLDSEGFVEVSERIGQLKLPAPDGKRRVTDCANTETLFRIIQSIRAPRLASPSQEVTT